MPLAESFVNGEDAWKRVKELSNPVHRIIEIHGNRQPLEEGLKAKNGTRFTELQQMVTQLTGIEHLFEQDGIVCKLLDAYRATVKVAEAAGHSCSGVVELRPPGGVELIWSLRESGIC
jgi:hypothetical protein